MGTTRLLTRDDVLAMPAGRKLDALVSEVVMGWTLYETDEEIGWRGNDGEWAVNGRDCDRFNLDGDDTLPFSKDIGAAWRIVEHILTRPDATAAVDRGYEGWFVSFRYPALGCDRDSEGMVRKQEAAPLAICRAALIVTWHLGSDAATPNPTRPPAEETR